jgi:predicted Rossmann fold flavoprotein
LKKHKSDLVVVGAGAAGLFASIHATELGLKVLTLEKNEYAGKKLFITGKGRCNVTNDSDIGNFINQIYPNGKFLYPAFKNFFVDEVISFFEKQNVPLELERGGRYFPKSNKSSDIVNALVNRCKSLKINILYNSKVINILSENNEIFGLEYESNNTKFQVETKKIILCTGGKSYPLTGSTGDGYNFAQKLGHTIIDPKPSLVSLICKDNFFENIDNLTLKNIKANLMIDNKICKCEFGELEIQGKILLGPVILTLSRWAVEALEKKQKVDIVIDFKPALDYEQLNKRLIKDFNENSKTKFENLLKLIIPIKLIPVFIKVLEIDKNKLANQLNSNERKKIIQQLKEFKISIFENSGFANAIITNGGINTKEINPQTMESKIIKGLFFAGEIIDLDAKTGGYNLQIAFSTGWLAAM